MILNIIARINDEVITDLTLAITGNIFPQIAFASIANIITKPIIKLVEFQSSKTRYDPCA